VRKELGTRHRFCGFSCKRHDIRLAHFAQKRLHGTLVQPFGQTDNRLSANHIVDIREPSCKSIANGWRVLFRKGTKCERRPVSNVAVLIGRKGDQRIDGGVIITAAKGVRKSTTNVLRRMACQSRKVR
jgi:hypothetical protein